jgi:hypothetical protein
VRLPGRGLLFAAIGVAVAVVLALVVPGRSGPGGRTVHVIFRVADGTLRKPGATCSGGGGYLYVHRGAPYTVVDAVTGDRLAKGDLPTGTAVRTGNPIAGAAVEQSACELRFDVVIPDRTHYELHLAQGRTVPFDRGQFGRDAVLRLEVP